MIDKAVRHLLTAAEDAAAVTAIAGTRIRPIAAGQLDARPCIVFKIDEPEARHTFTGPATTRKGSIEIVSYADKHDQCRDLSEAARAALNHQVGEFAGVKILCLLLSEQTDIEQAIEKGTEKPVYVRAQTFTVLWRVLES